MLKSLKKNVAVKHIKKAFINTNDFHDLSECLTATLELRDKYTSGHSSRVAQMSVDISKNLLFDDNEIELVDIAAHLHDIGKIGIPDYILNKEGKLLPNEYEIVKTHSKAGYTILSKSKSLKDIAVIVLHHHESLDGTGYPNGLKGKRIPLGSRIIAIADAIDAMTSDRPYRKAMSWNECIHEINIKKGIQFDPEIVEIANNLWGKWSIR